MVGIQGLGGVPEPKPERPASVRERNAAAGSASESSKDGVEISNAAQAAAASIAKTIQAAQTNIPDVREERVEAARQAIERGDYRRPEIVAKVADRISKYL